MKIEQVWSGATNEYKVTMLTEQELARSDADMITAVDNGGRWDLRPRHFGGSVKRGFYGPATALVRVYVD